MSEMRIISHAALEADGSGSVDGLLTIGNGTVGFVCHAVDVAGHAEHVVRIASQAHALVGFERLLDAQLGRFGVKEPQVRHGQIEIGPRQLHRIVDPLSQSDGLLCQFDGFDRLAGLIEHIALVAQQCGMDVRVIALCQVQGTRGIAEPLVEMGISVVEPFGREPDDKVK